MRGEEYYTKKQLEYISYYVRMVIYKRPQDKKKFKDICEKIKSTIQDYSIRNSIDSIFTSQKMWDKYYNMFIGCGYGLPNFQYRDDYQRKWKGIWDKKYWFFKNCNVLLKGDDELWKIKYINADTDFVVISKGYETKRVDFEKVKRYDELG